MPVSHKRVYPVLILIPRVLGLRSNVRISSVTLTLIFITVTAAEKKSEIEFASNLRQSRNPVKHITNRHESSNMVRIN